MDNQERELVEQTSLGVLDVFRDFLDFHRAGAKPTVQQKEQVAARLQEVIRAALLTTQSTVRREALEEADFSEAAIVDRILRAMNDAKITSRALASALGVSEPRVSQMLRYGSNMTLRTAEKVFTAIRSLPDLKGASR